MTEDHGRLVTLPWSRWLGTCKVEPNEGLIKGLLHVPMSTEGKMSLGRKRVGGTGEGIALRCGALRYTARTRFVCASFPKRVL